MITPTSFIDKKIFLNKVQDRNPGSIGYTLISLNLIFLSTNLFDRNQQLREEVIICVTHES